MIKYAEIEGYINVGEVEMFSHVYLFTEKNKTPSKVIIIHAYEVETKVFKGFLFNAAKTFKNVDLLEDEVKTIEKFCGKPKQVGFDELIKETKFAEYYEGYKEETKCQI